MKLKNEFVIQDVDDGFVAVSVEGEGEFSESLIRLNKTSAFLFEQLRDEISIDELYVIAVLLRRELHIIAVQLGKECVIILGNKDLHILEFLLN